MVGNYFGDYCLQALHSNKLLRASGIFVKSENLAKELAARLLIIALNQINPTRSVSDKNYEGENFRLAE